MSNATLVKAGDVRVGMRIVDDYSEFVEVIAWHQTGNGDTTITFRHTSGRTEVTTYRVNNLFTVVAR